MGTEKRQRQKAGRQARIEAAQVEQKKAENKRRVGTIAGVVGVVVLAGLLFAWLGRDKDDKKVETAGSSTTTTVATADQQTGQSTDQPASVESAAGKPCVAFADTLPEGAPEVPVEVGPPPTELIVKDLKEGSGDAVPDGATVTVSYIGVSCSTGKIFDSSWKRGEPATFPLSGVIDGWTQGIPGMKPGGQRLLVIPPDMGYGKQGSPPDIAPDETLYFVVDLVSVGG